MSQRSTSALTYVLLASSIFDMNYLTVPAQIQIYDLSVRLIMSDIAKATRSVLTTVLKNGQYQLTLLANVLSLPSMPPMPPMPPPGIGDLRSIVDNNGSDHPREVLLEHLVSRSRKCRVLNWSFSAGSSVVDFLWRSLRRGRQLVRPRRRAPAEREWSRALRVGWQQICTSWRWGIESGLTGSIVE